MNFKPLLSAAQLFRMYDGMSYFIIFLIYLAIAFPSKWITNIFVRLQQEGRTGTDSVEAEHLKEGRFFRSREKAK